jgi:hypothetical protein
VDTHASPSIWWTCRAAGWSARHGSRKRQSRTSDIRSSFCCPGHRAISCLRRLNDHRTAGRVVLSLTSCPVPWMPTMKVSSCAQHAWRQSGPSAVSRRADASVLKRNRQKEILSSPLLTREGTSLAQHLHGNCRTSASICRGGDKADVDGFQHKNGERRLLRLLRKTKDRFERRNPGGFSSGETPTLILC